MGAEAFPEGFVERRSASERVASAGKKSRIARRHAERPGNSLCRIGRPCPLSGQRRSVAQPGRALGLGPRRRRFKSCRSDHFFSWTVPREQRPSAGHIACGRAVLERFSQFLQTNCSHVDELATVTAEHARAFMQREEARGISPRTWNGTRTILRCLFRKREPQADAFLNYLATLPPFTANRSPPKNSSRCSRPLKKMRSFCA